MTDRKASLFSSWKAPNFLIDRKLCRSLSLGYSRKRRTNRRTQKVTSSGSVQCIITVFVISMLSRSESNDDVLIMRTRGIFIKHFKGLKWATEWGQYLFVNRYCCAENTAINATEKSEATKPVAKVPINLLMYVRLSKTSVIVNENCGEFKNSHWAGKSTVHGLHLPK